MIRAHLTLLLAAPCLAFATLEAQSVVAIRGATVIDGTGAAPQADQTVVVKGERILAVGPSASIAVPPGARMIDGAGRFIIPGLIDMHAHYGLGAVTVDTTAKGVPIGMHVIPDHDGAVDAFQTLLAFGVTTIRNPGGPLPMMVALRDSVRLGLRTGPRIFTAGEVIDATSSEGLTVGVKTEEDIRREVARQAALGVDYVKLYAGLGPVLVRAGIDEAHKRGVRAIGHLFLTTWTDAANTGIDGIVHIVPGSAQLLPQERRLEFQRRFRGTQFMIEWFNYVDLQSAETRTMLDALVRHNVFLDPTLVIFEAMVWGDSARITQNRDLVYAPPMNLANWRGGFVLTTGWKPEDFTEARRAWPNVLGFTKALYDGGVQLTVGTDMLNPWVSPGASLHRELELLVSAGIPPIDVLRMATRNGARSLGIESEVGTIAVGKIADLVMLSADPIADIRNTRQIDWVMQGGKLSRPADLLPPRLRADHRAH
ncbi:MAG: amidohydrolase family protein [Gemmatimonadaceae bacterium]